MAPAVIPSRGSYQGQDRFVLGVLGELRNGFFLDSGASDGVRGSNSELLEREYGWRGICVEPNRKLYEKLVRNRSCVCLNCCLYDREGAVEFLEAAEVYGGIVEEYDPAFRHFAEAQAAERRPEAADRQPVVKMARRIGSILKDHDAPRVIDYWSLDTEGSELAILRSFPFEEYRVRVITVEHNYTSTRGKIAAFLARRGFDRVGSLGIDDCYVWSGTASTPPWRSRAWSRSSRR
jgi:FkbM family methyltransferase